MTEAAPNTPRRNLIITGGINHDFEDTASALAGVIDAAGFKSEIYSDIDKGFAALRASSFDLVTLFTLRWRMLDDDKYIPFRREWAYEINASDQALLSQHVMQGGGLLGLHTTAICFDTWPEFFELLGVRWQWGETFHPPPSTFTVTGINSDHPATEGIGEFEITDEIYHNLQSHEQAVPLFAAASAEDGALHTLAFAQKFGQGRVIYNALGHDRAAMETPEHARFLQQSAQWLANRL